MSMSTVVTAFMSPDKKWQTMKAVANACKAAGIDEPEEVENYFGGHSPEDRPGQEVNIKNAVRKGQNEYENWIEVDLPLIPDKVMVLRFTNSW
jgi:hypothetical protein